MRPTVNDLADQLMSEGQRAAARVLLEEAIREMPRDWKPVRDDPDTFRGRICACWDMQEFLAYVGAKSAEGYFDKWIAESYSKGWYQLAMISVEEGDFSRALRCIESGLALEPDHPLLWNEKGYILHRQGKHVEALRSYERAASVRNWAPPYQIALALRGKGSALIDLKRIDEAEAAIKQSLVLDPESKAGRNELEYVIQLRRAPKEKNSQLGKGVTASLSSEPNLPSSSSSSPRTPTSGPGSPSSSAATSLEQSVSKLLDTLEKHPPPRARGVSIDNPEDVGPQVLEYMFRSLQIDPKWSIREPRKFTWWGHRLAQKVWADPVHKDQGYGIVRVHAETDLLKDVPRTQRTFEVVSAFNASGASMSAYLFETVNQRLKMHCSASFHGENAQWLGALFSAAVAIQAADAHIKLDGAVTLFRASPDETQHPVSGVRKEPDDILNVIEALFAPQGRGPSKFGNDDLASALAMKPSPWVMANGDHSKMTAEYAFPGCLPPTALLTVSIEERHPQLGSGAFFVLKLPVNLRGLNGEELANKLNCAEAAEWTHCHYFGGWCKDPDDNLAFVSFIPSTLRRPGLLGNLVYGMAHRANWSNDFLASEKGIPHKFRGRDRGSYQRQVQEHASLFTRISKFLVNRKPE